ncbi:MAG: phosphoenolpyruvate carboxylase [Micropruina glycogenica]
MFSWTQSRQIVPGWFSVTQRSGAAWSRPGTAITGRGCAASSGTFSHVHRQRQDDAHKTRMDVARHYVNSLVDSNLHHVFDTIVDEHQRIDAVLAVASESRPDAGPASPLLARTLSVRATPTSTPVSYLQVAMLARLRAGDRDPQLERTLLLAVNGVAQSAQHRLDTSLVETPLV